MTDHEKPNLGDIQPPSVYEFLDDPTGLRHALEARGALEFTPYVSGLFPASDLPPEAREATGMGMAWFRDNAHVANALYESGQTHLAVGAGRAMLTVLNDNRDILDSIPATDGSMRRLPVRVEGDTLANDIEPRVQNDSVGYVVWFTSRLINDGALEPSEQDLNTLAQTVRYLDKIEYWQDEDEGHWEEDRRIHASSIGVVVAGLREARKMFDQVGYGHAIDIGNLLDKGTEALDSILSRGVTDLSSPVYLTAKAQPKEEHYPHTVDPADCVRGFFEKFSVGRREHDAALLFLIEPLHVLEGEWAEKIVTSVEQQLQRDVGITRYIGDTYWEPRFPDIMSVEERTSSAEGRTEKRNETAAGVGYTGTEAQWTLFDPVLSTYWGRRYGESGDSSHREKQLLHLERSLAQLSVANDGGLRLPEAYYYKYDDRAGANRWAPNDHVPLLWSQANLLLALEMFEATTET